MHDKKIDTKVIRRLEDWVEIHPDRDKCICQTPYGTYSPRGILNEVRKDPPTDQGCEFARVFGNMLKPESRYSPREIYKDIKDIIECIPIVYKRFMERIKGPKKE